MNKKFHTKNIILFAAIILLIGVFSGCDIQSDQGNKDGSDSPAPAEVSFSEITPEEAKKRLDSEKGIILLDVRTKEEFDEGHIKDSVLIPVDTLETEAPKSLKDKEAVIFVYCRSGNRSAFAGHILANMGYTNVYDLGGIIDWPYEVVK